MLPTPGDPHLRAYFARAVDDSLSAGVGHVEPDVAAYLTDLLTTFMSLDAVYGLRDAEGRPVTSVAEMVEEGDVRLKADSFAREREVHRHIGDFLLFWSGLFPEQLPTLKSPLGRDALLDPVGQGRHSYHVASTFSHPPYEEEAATLSKLSEGFEAYRYGLRLVRAGFEGFARQGWPDGFSA